jgi:hypothetical protein
MIKPTELAEVSWFAGERRLGGAARAGQLVDQRPSIVPCATPLLQQSNPGVQFGTASNTGRCGRDMNVLPYREESSRDGATTVGINRSGRHTNRNAHWTYP